MKENGLLQFSDKSREELIENILEKERQLAEKDQRIRELEKKLKEQEAREKRLQEFKALKLAKIRKRSRKSGQKVGHVGLTRSKPQHIDQVVEQKLKACPDCHHRLSASQEIIEHIQEDIIPARPQVTCFKKHRYYCKHCKKLVTAPNAPEEVPYGYLGPNVLIQTVILKYHHGLPFKKIQELFESLCGFKVSQGALPQALQRLSEWLEVEVTQILEAVRASPHLHMDETGWKIKGQKHWLWAAVNEKLAYYEIARSRGAKVPKKILPKDYQGILVTDFYGAYKRLPGRKQKCLVHLQREMHSLYLKDQSEAYLEAHKKLKRILNDALRLKEKQSILQTSVYQRRITRLKERLFLWSCRPYRNKHLIRLSKRFLKDWNHLLTFLQTEVSSNNNLAERMIRHHVILRNRSFQNRSPKGAQAHQRLMSLLHTLQLQGNDVVSSLKDTYLRHRQGNPAPLLQFAK